MRSLISECVSIHLIDCDEVQQLFEIYCSYFAGTSFSLFLQDFRKKNKVILLRNSDLKIVGFSTIEISHTVIDGKPIRVLFSGDTIIEKEFWGTQALSRKFFEVCGEIYRENEDVPLYWLLIVKGHRTYRYLDTFFFDYFPSFDCAEYAGLKKLRDTLAREKFAENYDAKTGVIQFSESQGHLKDQWADIPAKDKNRPSVKYFLEKNPGYRNGDELVCLCELSPENHRPFARRIFESQVLEPS